MIINHNLMANNALRNMNINSNNASKAMEKLSSGLRINRAGDDAAGLAISEKMRGQINGLNQASSNSQDAISLIQTGEGALNETHSILQRMRTLATQSASDTNTTSDRQNIQKEVDQLAKEITRISNTTEFNTQNLLAGGLDDTFQIGANNGQNISLTVGAMDAQSLGVARTTVNGAIGATNSANVSSVEADNGIDNKLAIGDYTIEVDNIGAGGHSATSTNSVLGTAAGTAISGTATVDSDLTLTYQDAVAGVAATAAAAQAGGSPADTLAFNAGNGAEFNGIKIEISADDSGTATPGAAWNAATNTITVKLSGSTQTANTGANIETAIQGLGTVAKDDGTTVNFSSLTVTGAGTFAGSGTANTNATGTFTLAGGVSAVAAGWAVSGTVDNANYSSTIAATGTATIGGLDINASSLTGAVAGDTIKVIGTKDGTTTAQLFDTATTPNSIGEAVNVDKTNGGTFTIGDSTTGQLNITFLAGKATAGSTDVSITNSGSTAATFSNGQLQSEAVVAGGIDVSTQKAASIAITKIDAATQSVSAERAKLGAYQNRLEHTINNLGVSSENLTSAESRIRDVDMASEMSEYSKNNILSQAAQAMLAQANTQPQQVLQLLR